MSTLWERVQKQYQKDGIDGFEIIREKVNFKSEKHDLEALLAQIDGYLKFAEEIKIVIGDEEFSFGGY